MKASSIVWKPLKYLSLGIAIVAILLVIMSLTRTAIPLDFLKGTIQQATRDALGRELVIDGKIKLIPGLSPELSIQQVKLKNSGSEDTSDFASVEMLSAEIHLLPLLDAKIHVGDVALNGVLVNLIQPEEGKANWVFDLPATDDQENEQASGNDDKDRMQLLAIDGIQLENIALLYSDEGQQTQYDLALASGVIVAPEGEKARINLLGGINDLPFELQMESDPLQHISQLKFPLNFKVESSVGSAKLNADIDLLATGAQLSAELQGEDLDQLNEKLNLQLPAVHNYRASVSAGYTEKQLNIELFKAVFDDSAVDAAVNINQQGKPLAISGIIDIKTLNLDPLLESIDDAEPGVAGDSSTPTEPAENTKPADFSELVEQMTDLETNLSINIGQLTAGGIEVSDSSLQLKLVGGKLDTPLSIVINGIPMEGNLSILGEDTTVTANAFLEIENNDIGDLEQWFELDGIDGSLGKFSLTAQTRGDSPQAMVEKLSTKLNIENAELRYGSSEQTSAVDFTLENLSASVSEKSPLKIDVNGVLLDEAFKLNLNGGKLRQLIKGREWPLKITASGSGAELRVEGMVRKPGKETGSDLKISLAGSRLGELHNWLGVVREADADYTFLVSANTRSTGWEVSSFEAGVGDTVVNGKIENIKSTDSMFLIAEIVSPLINIPELTSFFPVTEQPAIDVSEQQQDTSTTIKSVKQTADSALLIPILPKGIVLADTDITVSIDELRLEGKSVSDISFNGAIRQGVLNSSPFSMRVGKEEFSGDIGFNSLSTPPSASLSLQTHDINIGELLEELSVAQGIELSAELLKLQMELKGHRLGDIINKSHITAEIQQGEWVLTDPGSGNSLPLELQQGTISITPGNPIVIDNQLLLNEEPLTISITLGRLLTGQKKNSDVELEIDIHQNDNVLTLTGTSLLPLSLENIALSLDLHGTNTGSLSTITGLKMPEIGPYKLIGRFTMNQQGYYLEQLQAQIGESVLEGTASLKTQLEVPEFAVQLVSERVQLNDFEALNAEDSVEPVAQSPARSETESDNNEEITAETETQKPRFDGKGLAMANGTFNLKAKEVVSGQDWLGEGQINIVLRDSRLEFNPVQLNLPGGQFNADMLIQPAGEMLDLHLAARIDQFDYGILARRRKPETEMSGVIDLDVSLDSQAQYLDELMANANGYIDFVLLPENFEAGIIDLWASSLLVAMLPKIGADVSLVNCVVAQFDIEDGLMKEESLYLDTSKLRAAGKGEINFKDQTISYVLKPKAKNAGFFQVQAPVKVDGSFADMGIGLKGGLLGTTLRMVATTYTVPIRVLMGKNVPRDGSDICIPLAENQRHK